MASSTMKVDMLVEMSYHIWHSNMADHRLRMLKSEKRDLQDELTRAKKYITTLEEENHVLQSYRAN